MFSGNGIVLRSTQVAALQFGAEKAMTVEPTTVLKAEGDDGSNDDNSSAATATITVSPNASAMYTAGQMAGVGAGVGAPLLLALVGAIFAIMRQRKRLHRAPSAEQFSEQKACASAAAYASSTARPRGHRSYYAHPNKPSEQSPSSYHQAAYPNAGPGHFREMDTMEPLSEMDNATQRQELPAGK